jgi:hypothetical protein
MKTKLLLLGLIVTGFAFLQSDFSVINWGYNAGDGRGQMLRSRMWVGPDGSINVQPQQPGAGGRVTIYPHATTRAANFGANAEIVIYGMSDQAPGHPEENFERLSIAQMNDARRMVRFSMERGGTGQYHPFEFCFDHWTVTTAWCPLRIDPTYGVLICNAEGDCRQLQPPSGE